MRSILSIMIAILYLILTLPVLGILILIDKKNPVLAHRVGKSLIQWIFRVLLCAAGTHITVIGRENIPADQAALFIGNHRSIYDILITYIQMERETGYVAKRTLDRIPLFSAWCHLIRCLFLDRDNLKDGLKMILDSIEQIRNGSNVFIFPEGTRNKAQSDLPLLDFHEGSFRIALKSGCPIVPVAINNTIQIFEGHKPWVKSTHVIIEFLKPIDPQTIPKEQKKQIGAIIRKQMMQAIEKNKALL